MHSEHDGEKSLFQQKLPGADAILGLEQPPATPLLHIVQRIARRGLHDLQQVGLRVEGDHLAERACRRFLDKAAYDTLHLPARRVSCLRATSPQPPSFRQRSATAQERDDVPTVLFGAVRSS
jgi:hypothetical protein